MNCSKLLNPITMQKMINFVNHMCEIYSIDNSHGIEHSFGTMNMAGIIVDHYLAIETTIIESLTQSRASFIIKVTAFIHDMIDDKYVKDSDMFNANLSLDTLLTQLEFNLYEISIVHCIIDNMSYSKRQKIRKTGKDIDIGKYQLALAIIRDADLINAYNADRAWQFSVNNTPNDKNIYKTVYELMSNRVLTYHDNEITTTIGKKLARIMHNTLEVVLGVRS